MQTRSPLGKRREISMKIVRIFAHRVELPLHEGSYKWSGGKSVAVFDSTVEIGGVASSPDLKFDRIVVGAPLWIRTRKMRAVRLSDEYTEAELDEEFNRAAMLKRRAQLVLTELGLLATPPPPESQAQRPRY